MPLQQQEALAYAGYAEAVVRVVKVGRDAGASGAAGHLDVMAPGASAGRAALACFRARRIAVRRKSVVIGLVPITAPFMHVLADVMQAERIGRVLSHWLGAGLQALFVIGQ